jgi:hypothetical protein
MAGTPEDAAAGAATPGKAGEDTLAAKATAEAAGAAAAPLRVFMHPIGAPGSQIVNNRQIAVDIAPSPMHDAIPTRLCAVKACVHELSMPSPYGHDERGILPGSRHFTP